MRRFIPFVIAATCAFCPPAVAQDSVRYGLGRLLTNDMFADMRDRWHTGSGVVSLSFGPAGAPETGNWPETPGRALELRVAGAVIAPESLQGPAPGDRPYAGIASVGLHTHFDPGPFEASLGVDLVATGPQTGMDGLQTTIHDLIGIPAASDTVLAAQLPDAVYPTALAELAWPRRVGELVTLRPFVEAQAGVEDFLRIGGDVLIGPAWQSGLWLREATSGQLYRTAGGPGAAGLSLLVGADAAKVWDSAYLPSADGYVLTDGRSRVRAGLYWQGERLSVFYGATWLGPEFADQSDGQIVGSLRIDMRF